MLEKRVAGNGVVFYQSPLLREAGVRHAFSTRIGGISPAPFDSLNLGNPNGQPVQDEYERIWRNYGLLQSAIDCNPFPPLRVHQVHGNVVVDARAGRDFDNSAKADAIVSDDSDRVISVRVADCLPVLLADGEAGLVAAVHAGWRGVVAGVVGAAVAAMIARGAKAGNMIAALGPCIGPEAFEVGPEVLREFEERFGEAAPVRRDSAGAGHVDLRGAVCLQLAAAGVSEQHIEQTDLCTVRDREDFFSHRRDRGITGRMAAVICANAI